MKTRRIFSAVLAIVLVLSTLTFTGVAVSADGVSEVYVDQNNGSADGAGTLDSPVKTLDKAFSMLTGDGTVYVIGEYSLGSSSLPSSSNTVTVAGYGNGAKVRCSDGAGVLVNSSLVLENIDFYLGTHSHLNTNGHKVTFGTGYTMSNSTAQIHVGKPSGGTNSEHVVIDGANVTSKTSFGGAYITTPTGGIKGNVTLEVISGTLGELRVSQDGYNTSHGQVTIGGDFRVRVGKNGKISKMSNVDRAAVVKGYLHLIVEDGGSMCELDMTNFDHKEYYRVNLPSTENGDVEFTDNTGVVNIVCDTGYVAKIETATGAGYVSPGEYKLPLGEAVTISFTDEVQLSPANVDVTIAPPTPGTSDWPISVNDNEYFNVEVVSVSPDDAQADYATQYTYTVELRTNEGYVFPSGFNFTINGKEAYDKQTNPEGYRLTSLEKTASDCYTFVYRLTELTAKDESRTMVTYEGGIGSAVISSDYSPNTFYENGATITIADNYFSMGGHRFVGYKDNVNGITYLPGAEYTLTEDVVFTAVWELLPTYQVIYHDGGADFGLTPSSSTGKLPGETVMVSENTLSKIGYVFTGWSGSDGKVYQPGNIITVGESHVELTAMWEINPVAGTFIYVSADGNATNDGLTPQTPVATIEKAYDLSAHTDATIIVIGKAKVPAVLPVHEANITISGFDGESVLVMPSGAIFNGATAIENVKIETESGSAIITNGYKSTIGPNIAYTNSNKLDVIDGAKGASVGSIDTTINSGVAIKNYYFGGANLADSTMGVEGAAYVTIKGASIDVLDFSPKGDVTASVGEEIVFNVDATIGTFKASKALAAATTKVTAICFNNSSIPAGFATNADLIDKIKVRTAKTYIIDSGVGGSVGVATISRGQFQATADAGDVYTCLATNRYTKSTSGKFVAKPVTNGINKVRYGTPYSEDITVTVSGTPTAGAAARSITASVNATDVCDVFFSEWTPGLINGTRFGYDTAYTATIKIAPKAGNFFNDISLPAITLVSDSGTFSTTANINVDGSISLQYTFDATDWVQPKVEFRFNSGLDSGEYFSEQVGYLDSGYRFPQHSYRKIGYYFGGYRDIATGNVYRPGDKFTGDSTTGTVFEIVWISNRNLVFPEVLILYDLTSYTRDKGRNPEFPNGSDKIEVEKAFLNLEHEINKSKVTKTTEFDHEQGVTVITADGGDKPITINQYTLDKSKIDANAYKYMTIVYYYESKTAAAAGEHGHINYGNLVLSDGSKSNWYGKPVTSTNTVVANKWAALTFDFTSFIEENKPAAGSILRQFHISPIGLKKCSELKGDNLYLKALYFSKVAPVID